MQLRPVEGSMNGCAIIRAMLRFEAKLEYTEDGCRVWCGAQTRGSRGRYVRKKRHKGKRRANNGPKYGQFWIGPEKRDTIKAHIFAAFLAGKISTPRVPQGMHLAHSCKHGSLCVDCTRLVPASVNLGEARTAPIRAKHRPSPSELKPRSRRKRKQPGNPEKFRHRQKEALTIAAE